MRHLPILLLLFSFLTIAFSADEERLVEATGGFSYTPPVGWAIREFPGQKYRLSHDQPQNQFSANINVVDESFDGKLGAYVQANLATLEKFYQKFVMVSQGELVTTAGATAHRLTVNGRFNDKELRQIFYFFKGNGKTYFVMTCTSLASDGDQRDALFEKAAKSFQVTTAVP